MDPSTGILSQWQFAITSIYHFFFVPLTLGLAVVVAIMETAYVASGKELYKQMTMFWGKLFTINFAMGVVTGIVMEFQFGMNWSEYSRYVGDVFGAPLAIEALLAFFLESTFLGIWLFGWGKISKGLHLTAIWLVAFGSNLSAYWILVANSFMQRPVGFVEENGRLMMNDFGALLSNAYVWGQFPHTVFAGFTTAAFFILGISAYHILRGKQLEIFKRSFTIGAIFGVVAVLMVGLIGHDQAQKMVEYQPMKIAAAEGLLESEDPASFSLFTLVDQKSMTEIVSIRIPYALSLLAYNRPSGEVKGINELQAKFEADHGPGNYVPSIFMTYWGFRVMAGLGTLMLLFALYALYRSIRNQLTPKTRFLGLFLWAIFMPYLANSSGWILTEMGRQPWVVYQKMFTANAFSPNLTTGMVIASLVIFSSIYGVLMGADVYLLAKYAKAGVDTGSEHNAVHEDPNWD